MRGSIGGGRSLGAFRRRWRWRSRRRRLRTRSRTGTRWRARCRPRARGAAEVRPDAYRAFTLDPAGLQADLATARAGRAAQPRGRRAVGHRRSRCPRRAAGLQRFAIKESPIMEDGLAAAHPEIKTYAGVGIDDPTATLRADTTPLGFHASVRSAKGAWYIDPYYHLDTSVYVSYYAPRPQAARGAHDRARRTCWRRSRSTPSGAAAAAGPDVQLRTYRLALVTDPSYATYFGAANVTAAKVTLMNRVDQIYEDELAIRMILINQTDKLNLNTAAAHDRARRPVRRPGVLHGVPGRRCCSGPLLKRNQIVIGQIIGASNYDIGHIALGIDGGGIAQLGVVGRGAKAWGCTGLPTPVGDLFAVDYVAHEMGHQFAGNHTFNGTLLNCSGAQPQRPDVGRARLGLVDHGLRRHLPPGQPAAALGPVLLPAQLRRDHELHLARAPGRWTRCSSSRCSASTPTATRSRSATAARRRCRSCAAATTRSPASRARCRRSCPRARPSPSSRGRAVTRATCSTSASRSSSAARSRASTSSRWSSTGTRRERLGRRDASRAARSRTAASSSPRPATTRPR